MTEHDLIDVLTAVAAYDQRTVGPEDVQAWTLAAAVGRWGTRSWALRAVVEHYANETDRLMPAHVTRRIRDRRERYARTYVHQPIPPHVRGVAAEIEWERQQRETHIATCMDRWASGQDERAA